MVVERDLKGINQMSKNSTSRRTFIAAGVATAAGSAFIATDSRAETTVMLGDTAVKVDYTKYKKAPGETKVVCLGGDDVHDGKMQRASLRRTFAKTGWRLIFVNDARFVKSELLDDADLFILIRFNGGAEGWQSEPIIEGDISRDDFMSDELLKIIIDNVSNRGMGLMPLHCTGGTRRNFKAEFNKFMGIENIPHGPQQPLKLHSFNQDHPVTKGITDFSFERDENFGVNLIDENAVALYESIGQKDNRHDIAGWSIERGKGRIVGLRAGHTLEVWRHPIYTELHWRAAHWAMKRDIPLFEITK